jgi:hypothetical protein
MAKTENRCAEPQVLGRKLIHIPIIHTMADMGGLSESVRRATLRKFGLRGLKSKETLVDKIWMEVEQIIKGLDLSYETVRIYQDGLPVCGREIEIVTDLAKSQSRNYRLLLSLREKGATIMGTESVDLLKEEYKHVKDISISENVSKLEKLEAHNKSLSDSLLKKRDQFIADRINRTLCPGETGILFLGMLHSPVHLLDRDIQVIYPITRPFEQRGK